MPMTIEYQRTCLEAAAAALHSARAAATLLGVAAPALEGLDLDGDLRDLSQRLVATGALGDAAAAEVAGALLGRCEALVAANTTRRTEWMPKACTGDDVVEWERHVRSELAPGAAALLPLAEALRGFLAARKRR